MDVWTRNRPGSIFWVPILGAAIGAWSGKRVRKKKEDNALSNEAKATQTSDAKPVTSD
jgi:hypothetical protein